MACHGMVREELTELVPVYSYRVGVRYLEQQYIYIMEKVS